MSIIISVHRGGGGPRREGGRVGLDPRRRSGSALPEARHIQADDHDHAADGRGKAGYWRHAPFWITH